MSGSWSWSELYSIYIEYLLSIAFITFGLEERAKHLPMEMSGGEQQRVAIARALVKSPKLLLADEPTGNLDTVTGAEVMETLKSLNTKGITILMVTHNPDLAARTNRIIRVKDGLIEGA